MTFAAVTTIGTHQVHSYSTITVFELKVLGEAAVAKLDSPEQFAPAN
jgi:hypothetical protein